MKKKITFFIIIILFNLAANYAHPVTPTFFKMLHLSDAMFGISYALMSTGMFVFSPFWGKITNVIPSKTAMAIGAIGYAIGQSFFGLAFSPTFIVIARLLAGMSCGAFFVGSLTYIANMSTDEQRGPYLTANATIQTVAGAMGFFIGGMIGEIGVHFAFIIQVIQLFSTGVLSYFLLASYLEEKTSNLKTIIKTSNPFKAFIDSKEFMTKSLAILFAMSTMVFLGYTSIDQSFNYYLKDVFNFSSSYNGIIKGTVGIVSLIFNMTICIYLMKKTDIKKSNIVILSSGLLFIILSLFMKEPLYFIISIMVYYGIYAISIPIVQNMITTQADKKTRNAVLGFYQATKSLGMIIGAYVAGIIYTISPMNPFIFGGISFLIATLLGIIYQRRTHHE